MIYSGAHLFDLFYDCHQGLVSKAIQIVCTCSSVSNQDKGAFKYYVIKEVGGWGQKMEILDDLQYCKSSKSWVGGPKKGKNMMT